MQIFNNQQNQVNFQKFRVLKGGSKFLDRETARIYREKLNHTKKFDLIVDSFGYKFRDRKTSEIYNLRYWGTGDEKNNSIIIGLENAKNARMKNFAIPYKTFDDVIEKWQEWFQIAKLGTKNPELPAQITMSLDKSKEI